jgi:hypothetical protein
LAISFLIAFLFAQLLGPAAAAADAWAGRLLTEVLAETRANGLPLIYSSQVVPATLRVTREPTATTPLGRLYEVLRPFGLTLKPVGSPSEGFIVVRIEPSPVTAPLTAIPDHSPLEEVTVYASHYSVVRQDIASPVEIPHTLLDKTAGAEQDALRVLHYFPGAATNGASALSHVRGAAEDETLVRFDGVELYDPVHLKDFQSLFGLIDPELVQSLDFFSGGAPVRFGNHTGGVVDIKPRHTEDTNNLLGASVLYTRAITSGSFNEGAGSWLMGYRQSNLPEVLNQFQNQIGEPDFADFIGRVGYEWSDYQLALGALQLRDDLRLFTPSHSEDTTARYRDHYTWLSLTHEWNDALRSTILISHADLSSQRQGSVDLALISNGALAKARNTTINTFQTDWTATFNETTALDWGLRVDRDDASYNFSSQANFFNPLAATFAQPAALAQQFSIDENGNLNGAYVSLHQRYHAWAAELGMRWDDYAYLDHAQRFSPRLNLQYELAANSNLHFSAGRYVQPQTLNSMDTSSTVPQFSEPESSRQFIAGLDHRFAGGINFRMEAYAKHNDHVRPHDENLLNIVTLAPELAIDHVAVAPHASSTRGVEVSLSSAPQELLSWQLSYAWSQARERVAGQSVPSSWDQTNALTGGFTWAPHRWRNSAAVSWHTGWPYTPLQVINNGTTTTIAVLGARNSQRFGAFASLNLRTLYSLPVGKGSLDIFFEVMNAFDRANDCCREATITQAANGAYTIHVEQESLFNLVPLAGVDWRF